MYDTYLPTFRQDLARYDYGDYDQYDLPFFNVGFSLMSPLSEVQVGTL